jgi:autotransporter translocation and assembly factor TamB
MLGKVFVIEGGGVIFDSADAKDPRLDVQASWRTPDGDTLFVYVAGTVSKPKLRFDRPDEQAWAMLLGGDASDITLTALDTLLADTPLAGVQVRKTSANEEEDEGATYTASYRVGERVIVEGNYQEAQSTGPDDTTAGGVGASVDWRMTKNWSLRGQLGTIGTGVDIVYQYRY